MAVASVDFDNIRVQYSVDNIEWHDFDVPKQLVSTRRSRRFATPDGDVISARYWRVVAEPKAATTEGVSIQGLDFHVCADEAGLDVEFIPFAFSANQYYSIVLTDQNAEVFSRGQRLASVAIPHLGAELSDVTFAQSLDTLILFHEAHPPWRVFRQGAHDEWDGRAQVFENLPLFDFDGTNTGSVNAVQQILFRDYAESDVFNITLGGETTNSIIYTSAGVAAAVQAALGNLRNVDASGVSVTGSGTKVTITFSGKQNGGREWAQLFCDTISGDGAALGAVLTQGQAGGEAVMSATRGWPRCGAFFGARGWVGGFRSRPSTFLASVSGSYFNYETGLGSADVAFDLTLDGETVQEIRHIIPGRNLHIFTSSTEHSVLTRPLTLPLDVPAATYNGVMSGVRPVKVGGSTLYLQNETGTLMEYIFSDAERSYTSTSLAINFSHLLTAPIDMVRRPARTAKEADYLFVVNADGTGVGVTVMFSQDILAAARVTMAEPILATGVEGGRDLLVAVQRGDEISLEVSNAQSYLDGSVAYTLTDETLLDGLDHFEGQEVCVMSGEHFIAKHVVTGGAVTLTDALSGAVEAGRDFDVVLTSLPVRENNQLGGYSQSLRRIIGVTPFFDRASAFEVSANGSDYYQKFPQRPANLALGEFVPNFTGAVPTLGFPGASERPDCSLRQIVPGPFRLKSINLEVKP